MFYTSGYFHEFLQEKVAYKEFQKLTTEYFYSILFIYNKLHISLYQIKVINNNVNTFLRFTYCHVRLSSYKLGPCD